MTLPHPVIAPRSEAPRYLIFPKSHSTSRASEPACESTALMVRRVRVVPDLTNPRQSKKSASKWPAFDGFALMNRTSGALVRLYVIHPSNGTVMEWRLDSRTPSGPAPMANERVDGTGTVAEGSRHDKS